MRTQNIGSSKNSHCQRQYKIVKPLASHVESIGKSNKLTLPMRAQNVITPEKYFKGNCSLMCSPRLTEKYWSTRYSNQDKIHVNGPLSKRSSSILAKLDLRRLATRSASLASPPTSIMDNHTIPAWARSAFAWAIHSPICPTQSKNEKRLTMVATFAPLPQSLWWTRIPCRQKLRMSCAALLNSNVNCRKQKQI